MGLFVQLVGPLSASPAKALPEDFQAFLVASLGTTKGAMSKQPAGTVYMSMGTAVRFTEAEIRTMAANLVALQRPVLWKLPQTELPGLLLQACKAWAFLVIASCSGALIRKCAATPWNARGWCLGSYWPHACCITRGSGVLASAFSAKACNTA